ncbi:MAG: hypothetical protein SGILL_004996 [Bacillariaceae sp.]
MNLTKTPFTTICVYNYTTLEELEDDDEYEEIVENLKAMANKIGPVANILVPREFCSEESADASSLEYPVFIEFEKEADAAAAQGTWNDLVVGGSKLSVVGLDTRQDGNESSWSNRVVEAEQALRNAPESFQDSATAIDVEMVLHNVLTDDDYEDEDCMEESLGDLRKVAEQHGTLEGIHATKEKDGNVVLTYHCTPLAAQSILADLCGTVVGGQLLYASMETQSQDDGNKNTVTILLDNILTKDDLEDEDCLAETLSDTKELFKQYGEVAEIGAKGGSVRVVLNGDPSAGDKAVSELNGLILGGNVIAASLADKAEQKFIDLHNVLTEDDLEDPDCLEESLADIRELAAKYGVISNIEIMRADDRASIRIHFEGDSSVASAAAKSFDGMLIGGQICSVRYDGNDDTVFASSNTATSESSGEKRKSQDEGVDGADKKARTDDKAPLYSGDKLIPERFAEMKRVPKVPNTPGPREYAAIVADERAKPLLIEMLGELMRLQKRAIEDKNAKARRRLVMGLREVARGIRAHKGKANEFPLLIKDNIPYFAHLSLFVGF